MSVNHPGSSPRPARPVRIGILPETLAHTEGQEAAREGLRHEAKRARRNLLLGGCVGSVEQAQDGLIGPVRKLQGCH
jgi:hypothetical protein